MGRIQGFGCELFRIRTVREHEFRETGSRVYEIQEVKVADKIADVVSIEVVRHPSR